MNAFDKIIGYESVKEELYQIIDMFKNKELYEKMGAKLPKGVLISGAPGMGKTMLCNALIEASGVPTFLLRKTKDGKGVIEDINRVFTKAASEPYSIILIDDIDKFSEGGDIFDEDADEFVVIQSAIDNAKDSNILVIATANNDRKLPASLKRSGRFDRRITLNPPTNEDARKIIEHYMKEKCVDPDMNYEDIARMIDYKSCADLEKIINESAILAAYKRKPFIDISDIISTFLKEEYNILEGNETRTEEEIKITALHEAGHVVIGEVIKEGHAGFVSVRTRGTNNNNGFTHFANETLRRPEEVLILLGGKAAVELFNGGRCASGCQSDLSRALDMLMNGVGSSGTLGIGLLDMSDAQRPMSPFYNYANEEVVKAETERLMFIAKDILLKNKDFLMKVRDELIEKHNLLYSDIKRIRESCQITPVVIP